MSESRIVVETPCPHGSLTRATLTVLQRSSRPINDMWRRIIDPGSLPAEVIEAATEAIGESLTLAALPGRGVLRQAAEAALSAAFRTLGEME